MVFIKDCTEPEDVALRSALGHLSLLRPPLNLSSMTEIRDRHLPRPFRFQLPFGGIACRAQLGFHGTLNNSITNWLTSPTDISDVIQV